MGQYGRVFPMTPAELHAEAMQHYAMAHHYLGKLKTVLDQMGSVQSGSLRAPVRCVREWQDWLAVHGPAYKTDVAEQTGVRFTERGTPYTVDWIPSLATEPDDHFDPSTLMKISAPSDGRGRPPVIFFLWSQRFDVLPRFGVGPIRPEAWVLQDEHGTDYAVFEPGTQSNEIPLDGAMSGMLVIPVEPTFGPTDDLTEKVKELLAQPSGRCATMAEWDELHSAAFDAMVLSGAKPTDEQKTLFRDTCPSGEDANAAIAIAHRNAKVRAQGVTGVVQPPISSHPILPAHGEEIPIDWDAP